ncbi:hypothetical protein BRADI_4g23423v3 [Brachypodium distachyon]|uniref:Uncharacterized protein n=1 Tax=Brachypodium distachyon TaxID=15368 RepID=A0A2K2CPR3_BRADI|nr:hypothetical protein BRADI_4g23423v3 [Brachypodium distachyon]
MPRRPRSAYTHASRSACPPPPHKPQRGTSSPPRGRRSGHHGVGDDDQEVRWQARDPQGECRGEEETGGLVDLDMRHHRHGRRGKGMVRRPAQAHFGRSESAGVGACPSSNGHLYSISALTTRNSNSGHFYTTGGLGRDISAGGKRRGRVISLLFKFDVILIVETCDELGRFGNLGRPMKWRQNFV